MTSKVFLLVCVAYVLVMNVDSARILAMFPIPSLSHQYVFRAYTQELAKRGHELVVITPNPSLPKDRPPDNITEIDLGFTYLELVSFYESGKRGVIVEPQPDQLLVVYSFLTQIFVKQLNSPEVKKIIDNKEKFDLIVVEAFLEVPFILSHIFEAPMITFASFVGLPEIYDAVGASSRHPIYYPNLHRTKLRNLTFLEKIQEVYKEYKLMGMIADLDDVQNEALKKIVNNPPTVRELRNNIELVFLNAHPILANNRPVPPNLVFLGGLHLKPVQPLSKDLQEYLDSSSRGVVYVSFGSNVKPSQMDEDLLDAFLDGFESLPYDVLWKFDGDLKRKPKNLRIQKWFPQRDLLTHANIKVFVTQGGLQSFDEAVDAAVPLVGIPIMNDQWYNVNKFVELGIGVQLDALTLTAKDVTNAVLTVVENRSYRDKIVELRAIYHDQPQKPIERAMFWTEHVLKHGGRHLRAPTANVTWSDYWMTDVLAAVVAAALLVAAAVTKSYFAVTKFYMRSSKVKMN